jgi:hypothetical protein
VGGDELRATIAHVEARLRGLEEHLNREVDNSKKENAEDSVTLGDSDTDSEEEDYMSICSSEILPSQAPPPSLSSSWASTTTLVDEDMAAAEGETDVSVFLATTSNPKE